MHGLPRVNFGHVCARHAAALRGGASALLAFSPEGPDSCRNAALFLLGRAQLLENMAALCRTLPAGAFCDAAALFQCAGKAISGACSRRSLCPQIQPGSPLLPVPGTPRTLLPVVLALLRCAMLCGAGPVLCCRAVQGFALLRVRSSGGRCLPPDPLALDAARLLAQRCGGRFVCIVSPAGGFDACLALPLCPGAALCPVPEPEALLRDRYSPLFTQLAGFCILPD